MQRRVDEVLTPLLAGHAGPDQRVRHGHWCRRGLHSQGGEARFVSECSHMLRGRPSAVKSPGPRTSTSAPRLVRARERWCRAGVRKYAARSTVAIRCPRRGDTLGTQPAGHIAFGRFRLDRVNECLWREARAIPLRPKAFAVLKLLVEHPGQLVTKQQLLETVWPATFVSDAVLKDCIRQLREALGDAAGSPRYIETAHRRGYRFIGHLGSVADEDAPALPGPAAIGGDAAIAPADADRPNAPAPAHTVLGRDAELTQLRNCSNRRWPAAAR